MVYGHLNGHGRWRHVTSKVKVVTPICLGPLRRKLCIPSTHNPRNMTNLHLYGPIPCLGKVSKFKGHWEMIFQHQSKILLPLINLQEKISKIICQVIVINNVLLKCLCLYNSLQNLVAEALSIVYGPTCFFGCRAMTHFLPYVIHYLLYFCCIFSFMSFAHSCGTVVCVQRSTFVSQIACLFPYKWIEIDW